MHRLPRFAQTLQSFVVRGAEARSCVIGSQPRARVFSWAPNPSTCSRTSLEKKTDSQEGTIVCPYLHDTPIVSLWSSIDDSTLGMRMGDWQSGRYAWALDNKLRSMSIPDSQRYLRSELGSLMMRYQHIRATRRRHVGFEEDLIAVEKAIMRRCEVFVARICKFATYEDGLKAEERSGEKNRGAQAHTG
ncbi:hypothetical protein F5X96DRAFT_333725 [Biscogniauxia mediterranea]|nr:hypothetical protein F5X96DRAFT_333725 [Biscogniauxia mediterranea]